MEKALTKKKSKSIWKRLHAGTPRGKTGRQTNKDRKQRVRGTGELCKMQATCVRIITEGGKVSRCKS